MEKKQWYHFAVQKRNLQKQHNPKRLNHEVGHTVVPTHSFPEHVPAGIRTPNTPNAA